MEHLEWLSYTCEAVLRQEWNETTPTQLSVSTEKCTRRSPNVLYSINHSNMLTILQLSTLVLQSLCTFRLSDAGI